MAKAEQEVEVKFFVRDLAPIAERLQALGAQLSVPRVRETNLRFDTSDGVLTNAHQVLRLRQDAGAVMTFKGPAQAGQSVSVRQEIEFTVSDFTAARHLLEALGYQVVVIYEKYRTTYDWRGLMITLDEMPIGAFLEIEGKNAVSIQAAAEELGLSWDARSTDSYLGLFDKLRAAQGLSAQNMTFAELKDVQAPPQEMGLQYAD